MEQEKFSRKTVFVMFIGTALLCGIALIAIIPHFRTSFRQFFHTQSKQILASVKGDIGESLKDITVIKSLANQRISIEIYKGAENPVLLESMSFDEGKDGYFMFMNESTNLALGDYDHDGYQEILVPTFDEQMSPRLHVIKYNSATKSFEQQSGN